MCPICPITVSAHLADGIHEKQQLTLKLACSLTIHTVIVKDLHYQNPW